MFSEKTRLTTDKKDNPFYGSYKENSALEEIHWQNKKKKHQLCIVATVITILTLLTIGIILAITLPGFLENKPEILDPLDVTKLGAPSDSVLGIFEKAGVSSEDETCSRIGSDILKNKNGTAVDAAIAVTLCLGVVSPQSSGLGGGIFMTIYSGNQMYALNARETAPALVDPNTYVDNPKAASSGPLSVGVPGELAALWEAHKRFGKVSWNELVLPAMDLASNGFTVTKQLGRSLNTNKAKLLADPGLSADFVNPATNDVWVEGDTITRQRLATTLEEIGQRPTSFYNGTLASRIMQDLVKAGSIIDADDLSDYTVEWVDPISYKYGNNLTLYSLPFPSSGPVVALTLGILEGFGIADGGNMSVKDTGLDLHHLAEALKFASAHRSRIADPIFEDMSTLLDQMLSPTYAKELRDKIADYKTYDDPAHYGAVFAENPDAGTAHISIIGPSGDAVSLTTTINNAFGAGFMGETTGIIFNNEMRDFSLPNQTSVFGLPSNPLNFVEPGKRPASSMAPLIFLNSRNQPVLATGGAGGERIVSAVISTTWRALYRKMDIKRAIDYPRFMARFEPQGLEYEYGLPASFVEELRRRGHRLHRLNTTSYMGAVNSVCRTRTTSRILTNADYRKHGGSAGF